MPCGCDFDGLDWDLVFFGALLLLLALLLILAIFGL
jgi:hypothetical protein